MTHTFIELIEIRSKCISSHVLAVTETSYFELWKMINAFSNSDYDLIIFYEHRIETFVLNLMYYRFARHIFHRNNNIKVNTTFKIVTILGVIFRDMHKPATIENVNNQMQETTLF